jgi:hypothetical protein
MLTVLKFIQESTDRGDILSDNTTQLSDAFNATTKSVTVYTGKINFLVEYEK